MFVPVSLYTNVLTAIHWSSYCLKKVYAYNDTISFNLYGAYTALTVLKFVTFTRHMGQQTHKIRPTDPDYLLKKYASWPFPIQTH